MSSEEIPTPPVEQVAPVVSKPVNASEKVWCDVCQQMISKQNLSVHVKTNKHVKGMSETAEPTTDEKKGNGQKLKDLFDRLETKLDYLIQLTEDVHEDTFGDESQETYTVTARSR